ncbi:hypothetical protein G6F31_017593 [Rhizopus arrhizus]|nr:hypothetical protein G6F31_017593 [Rhizopus arrhizus]
MMKYSWCRGLAARENCLNQPAGSADGQNPVGAFRVAVRLLDHLHLLLEATRVFDHAHHHLHGIGVAAFQPAGQHAQARVGGRGRRRLAVDRRQAEDAVIAMHQLRVVRVRQLDAAQVQDVVGTVAGANGRDGAVGTPAGPARSAAGR